jgi:hypothetical protein
MKLPKIFPALLAGGALTLGGITGIAGTASAASWTYLCAVNPVMSGDTGCMLAHGIDHHITMETPRTGTTNWTYPNTNGAEGEIKQANTNLCIQVNASDSDYVRENTCVGDAAEEWINFYNAEYKETMFKSVWNQSLCLDDPANGNQQVYSCSTSNVAEQYSS